MSVLFLNDVFLGLGLAFCRVLAFSRYLLGHGLVHSLKLVFAFFGSLSLLLPGFVLCLGLILVLALESIKVMILAGLIELSQASKVLRNMSLKQ